MDFSSMLATKHFEHVVAAVQIHPNYVPAENRDKKLENTTVQPQVVNNATRLNRHPNKENNELIPAA